MNDEQAEAFMTAVVDRTIVNVMQDEGYPGGPRTTLFLDDGTELEFDTDSIGQADELARRPLSR